MGCGATAAEKKRDQKYGKFNWEELDKTLPSELSAFDKQKRLTIWTRDMGFQSVSVSFKDIEAGMKKIPGLPPEILTHVVLKAAFRVSRGAYEGLYDDKEDPENTKMQWNEFRIFLIFVKQYFRFYVLFDSLDDSGDGQIQFGEFKQSLDYLKKWGVDIKDPEKEFKLIDTNGNSNLSFKEFTKWAIQKSLSNEENGGKDVMDEAARDVLESKMKEEEEAEKKAKEAAGK